MTFLEFMKLHLRGGRIGEIWELSRAFYGQSPLSLPPEIKAAILCDAMSISIEDLDTIIATHSEVSRTVKGHAFEVIFDIMMEYNHIHCEEVGGDTDIDRRINSYSLQLKTPYINGCNFPAGIVSYKTHKTHGAKSKTESMDYYHKVSDFADYLVGLIGYEPFQVVIIPKNDLPQVPDFKDYIESPMYIHYRQSKWLNRFSNIGIDQPMTFPQQILSLEANECLPLSSRLLGLRSDYILRAIFIKDNFRIWDMNMRGFIREHMLHRLLTYYHIKTYPVNITGLERSDKCDMVLKTKDQRFVRFQIKGLTWNGCRLDGQNTTIDCETQLSRGRVNDHPTQSRLYLTTDFEYLMIAMEPPYVNTLTLSAFGSQNYHWQFYCIPMSRLKKHPKYPNRVFSHQYIPFIELQHYLIDQTWLDHWETCP